MGWLIVGTFGVVGLISRPIGHQHFIFCLLIIRNRISSISHRGTKLHMDLGEVHIWEHEDSLIMKIFEPVPIVTPHFIEIGLGHLELLNGLLLYLGEVSHQVWHSDQSPLDQESEKIL